MATKRKSISKKTRFEVFKRDGFKCQYCGATAPEAVLVVDHIHPVSKDGDHDVMNFITACQPCNAGKGARTLDDDTAIQKQRAQLDELNARREQLEMMLQWRGSLKDIGEMELEAARDAWSEAAQGWYLNDVGVKGLRGHIKKHGLLAVLDAIERAGLQYIKRDEEGKPTAESVELAWQKVGGILRIASLPDDEKRLHYIKGILRNRLGRVPYDAMRELKSALDAGVCVEEMQLEAKNCRSWSGFIRWIDADKEAV